MNGFTEIIAHIARRHHTTPELVLREMQLAIDEAYDHHDPAAQPLWDALHFAGERPSPEEFVREVAQQLTAM